MWIINLFFFPKCYTKNVTINLKYYTMANHVVDNIRDETNDRTKDVIDHFDTVNKNTIDLFGKLSDSFFKIARDIHEDVVDRQKDKKD